MASHGNMSVPLHVMLNYGAKGENRNSLGCYVMHDGLLMFRFYSVAMCRVEGGILHIHGNVNDSDEARWLDNVVESISNIAKAHGKNGDFML